MGGRLLGWRTVCAVELNPYCREVLLARQRDGHLEPFPIWDDVKTFDGKPWKGSVDIVSGGFPCQDISSAGKGAGITGSKSSLWLQMARIIGEVLPSFVFVENSPNLTSRGLGDVLGSLSQMGYNARWGIIGARHTRAPHKRDRIWIHGHTNGNSKPAVSLHDEAPRLQSLVPDANKGRHRTQEEEVQPGRNSPVNGSWWEAEPGVGRVVDGVAHRVDRLRAIGNGQVPAVAKQAWRTLSD